METCVDKAFTPFNKKNSLFDGNHTDVPIDWMWLYEGREGQEVFSLGGGLHWMLLVFNLAVVCISITSGGQSKQFS